MNTSTLIATLLTLGLSMYVIYLINYIPEMPKMDMNKVWGSNINEDVSIRKIKLEINDTVIIDLKNRLANRRPFRKPIDSMHSEYGINTIYLEKILNYWQNNYDFKKRFDSLNRFDHYKTRIQGLDIHFIKAVPNSKGLKVVPLLMLHGWPSSSKEFDMVIPILTTPREGFDFVFEVIAADLPGFGFSEGTDKPGLNPAEIGIVMRNLMKRLGHNEFYVHAGDWGYKCAAYLATIFPDEVLGFHTNMPITLTLKSIAKMLIGSIYPALFEDPHIDRLYPLSRVLGYLGRESGYFHLQATKPDTIGAALTDTPVGLAAYLIEKMAAGSNNEQLNTIHGGIENLNLDDVLDTITIVWMNNCITTSNRIYLEGLPYFGSIMGVFERIPTPVPTAAIKFKYEIIYQPDWIIKDKYPNLIHSTTVDYGGHFAGLQTPKELAHDIFEATKKFIAYHSNQKVKNI